MPQFIVKKLVASELILFKSLYQVRVPVLGLSPNTQQKAISPPSELLRERFPSLPVGWKGRVDLRVFGPGAGDRTFRGQSLTKQAKNWRIEKDIEDPDFGSPYSVLRPGDYGVMEFHGAAEPVAIDLYLVSAAVPGDTAVLEAIHALHRVKAPRKPGFDADAGELVAAIDPGAVPPGNPLVDMLAGRERETLGEAAAGGDRRAEEHLARVGVHLDATAFNRFLEARARTGRAGEELVDRHLAELRRLGLIDSYRWVSDGRPGSPHDFEVTVAGALRRWEVKSTRGDFGAPFVMSREEIDSGAAPTLPYDIVRVSGVLGPHPEIRIARDANGTLDAIRRAVRCPAFVDWKGLSLMPRNFTFGEAETLAVYAGASVTP